jgi:hypothetical protein
MIIKEFYTQKKNAIEAELISMTPTVHLYSDTVFKNPIQTPVVMFKYDTISWESSSEKNYKADVSFCLYIVLPVGTIPSANYEDAFEIAHLVDKAVLSNISSNAFIDTNSTFKVQEKQYTNENNYWDKNDYFIWKITYKTTLIETTLKKKYILFNNGLSNDALEEMGYNLTSDIIAINNNKLEEAVDLKIKNN